MAGFLGLLRQTGKDWWEDKCPRLAAALAFYVLFALAPLMLVCIAIAGLAFGHGAAEDAIVSQAGHLFGSAGAEAVRGLIDEAASGRTGVAGAAIGTVALLVGSSGVFVQLQDALDTVWEVRVAPGVGLAAKLSKRLRAFTMVLGIGFLLLVSLVISAGLSAISTRGRGLPGGGIVWLAVDALVSLAVIALLFVLLFREVPDAVVRWRDAWVGGVVTAALFALGKVVLGVYLGASSKTTAFGAASSMAVLLLWVYYCAQIVLLGAEFTQAYAKLRGRAIQPKAKARRVTSEARAQEGMAP
jgi:membrane protein